MVNRSDNPKTEFINIRVTPAERKGLDKAAAKKRLSLSSYIRYKLFGSA